MRLRAHLVYAAAFLAFAGAARAADPSNFKALAPAMAAPVFTWTGPYIGADIGGGWAGDHIQVPNDFPDSLLP